MNDANRHNSRWLLLAILLIGLPSGCVKSEPAAFRLNSLWLAKRELPAEGKQAVANVVEAMFGTPDDPYVLPETGLDARLVAAAAGPVGSDEQGTGRGLFRRHCAHCHGVTGDGQGPTAAFLNPYPRDYRHGKFKFKSTERPARPTRADLEQILLEGVAGTSMPSFRLLPQAELDALVEYVVYLSIRGEVEIALIDEVSDLSEGDEVDSSRGFLVEELLGRVARNWADAEKQVIRPAADTAPAPDRSAEQLDASIAAGRELFYGKRANCVKCHGPSALGDGQTTDQDDWNKLAKEQHAEVAELLVSLENLQAQIAEADADQRERLQKSSDKLVTRLALKQTGLAGTLPVRNIRPRNLRADVYRGGRRPLDIFRRIYAGINGAPMPGVGSATPGGSAPAGGDGAAASLSEEEIWKLVDYVQSLPFEPQSRPPELPAALRRERL